jgi:hypothetical protein
MANTKIFKFVQPFSGEGDVVQWLDKLILVCNRLEEDQAKVFPLLLEGAAFAVFSEMSDSQKGDSAAISKVLKEAFGISSISAFEQLMSRRWQDGEPVEVFFASLRRLAKLANVESDALLRQAFIIGLPSAVSHSLRTIATIDEMSVVNVVNRARSLMTEAPANIRTAASALKKVDDRHGFSNSSTSAARDKRRCFRCNGPHLIRDCTQGNGSGRAAAPVALPFTQ